MVTTEKLRIFFLKFRAKVENRKKSFKRIHNFMMMMRIAFVSDKRPSVEVFEVSSHSQAHNRNGSIGGQTILDFCK